jgi:CRP/FNR family transcriptional regulator, cyclic AMP receptor protein
MSKSITPTDAAIPAMGTISSPPSHLLPALAKLGIERSYRKGTLLIQEGDEGGTLYIVQSGALRAFSQSPSGHREISYGVYGPGDYVGEMSLDGGPRSASVETIETTTCVVITRDTLKAFIAQEPEFAFELLNRVIRRARLATLSAKKMALVDVYSRLVELLESMAGPPDAQGFRAIEPRITHADIAARIGASREFVSRLLKHLQRGDYLRVDGRRWSVAQVLPKGW